MRRTLGGFTLIEIMIVVLILGIIAAIAYPSYTSQVQRSRRTDATEALLARAQALERCFTRYSRYDHDDCNAATGFPYDSENGFYSISAGDGVKQNSFKLIATAQGAQANDTSCTKLTVDQTGQRKAYDKQDSENKSCW